MDQPSQFFAGSKLLDEYIALTVKLSMKAFVDDSREQTFIRAEVEIERLVI